MNEYQYFIDQIKKHNHIALTAPAGADGDSVGTQCALRELLLKIFPEKRIRIINEDACPFRYKLLKQTIFFERASEVVKTPRQDWPELMICVDGGYQRIGEECTQLWVNAQSKAQVDHHASAINDRYDFRLFDPHASSTTVLVYRLAKELKIELNQDIAQSIYTGMIFDTGQFKHSNTTPETLLIASDLMKTGFNHTETVEKTMLIRTQGSLALLKILLNRMTFETNKKYVWAYVNHQDMLDSNSLPEDREGLIDFLFLTPDCQIAAFYFEIEKSKWKMSFRSRDYDVAKMAQEITPHGGGHKKASGCTLHGQQDEVLKICHEAIKKTLNGQ